MARSPEFKLGYSLRIKPGDNGTCPKCGQAMKEGRYFHMKTEHKILEDYKSGRS